MHGQKYFNYILLFETSFSPGRAFLSKYYLKQAKVGPCFRLIFLSRRYVISCHNVLIGIEALKRVDNELLIDERRV